MKVCAPSLAPILRSGGQGRMLAGVMLDPRREWTVSDLAKHSQVAPATALREVRRMEQAGLVSSRKIGSARLVRANTTARHYQAVREIVLAGFGPPVVITEEFQGLAGVAGLVLFGSWVARKTGQVGVAPADIDVLLLGQPNRQEAWDKADCCETRLGIEVNVTIRPVEAWTSDDPFMVNLRQSPHQALLVDTCIPELAGLTAGT